jgi:hypothetical protein
MFAPAELGWETHRQLPKKSSVDCNQSDAKSQSSFVVYPDAPKEEHDAKRLAAVAKKSAGKKEAEVL